MYGYAAAKLGTFVHMRKDLLNRGIVQILSPSAKVSESGIVDSNEIEEKLVYIQK